MTTYEDALTMILKNTHLSGVEEKPLFSCIGQVSGENVYADISLPQSDISGPDGYAVKSQDIMKADKENPAILRIIATARAGKPSNRVVKPGTAIRIMTGSVIPKGADCVVRFEDTDEPENKNGPNNDNPSKVKIYVSATPGANIRPSGGNVQKGNLVLPKGTVIGPSQISALTSIGKTRIKVIRRPVIAVIATGDELVNAGKPLPLGKVYNCNTATIASLVTHYGGIPKVLGIARDKEAALALKIQKGMKADAIITTGGVSKGDYDLVRLVLGKIGKVLFSRINMAPGAAVAFGTIKEASKSNSASIPVFALAGPPGGSLINFEMLVRPAILKMRGLTTIEHPSVEATTLDSIPNNMPISFVKFTDLKKTEGGHQVTLNLMDKIGMLTSMATANSLTIIPEGAVVKAGDKIRVLPLDWRKD